MRPNLYKYCQLFSNRFSVENYRNWTGERMILPFYHTVSNQPKPHFSEIGYFRTEKDFVGDLDFFQSHYQSVSIEDLDSGKNCFHLTFDDGMSEIFSVVYPFLKERNLHASIFINTDFIDNKKLFVSHKKSLVLSELKSSEDAQNKLSEHLDLPAVNLLSSIKKIKKESEVDELAKMLRLDFESYLQEEKPYLTTKQLLHLKSEGFTIGNHTKSHYHLNEISFARQKDEVKAVNDFLKNEMRTDDLYFCFPYGDFGVNKEFFEWLYFEGGIIKSFGVSGLKKDEFEKHEHRILMEHDGYSAEEIIKFEYFYFLLKSVFGRNKIKR